MKTKCGLALLLILLVGRGRVDADVCDESTLKKQLPHMTSDLSKVAKKLSSPSPLSRLVYKNPSFTTPKLCQNKYKNPNQFIQGLKEKGYVAIKIGRFEPAIQKYKELPDSGTGMYISGAFATYDSKTDRTIYTSSLIKNGQHLTTKKDPKHPGKNHLIAPTQLNENSFSFYRAGLAQCNTGAIRICVPALYASNVKNKWLIDKNAISKACCPDGKILNFVGGGALDIADGNVICRGCNGVFLDTQNGTTCQGGSWIPQNIQCSPQLSIKEVQGFGHPPSDNGNPFLKVKYSILDQKDDPLRQSHYFDRNRLTLAVQTPDGNTYIVLPSKGPEHLKNVEALQTELCNVGAKNVLSFDGGHHFCLKCSNKTKFLTGQSCDQENGCELPLEAGISYIHLMP